MNFYHNLGLRHSHHARTNTRYSIFAPERLSGGVVQIYPCNIQTILRKQFHERKIFTRHERFNMNKRCKQNCMWGNYHRCFFSIG